MTRPDGSAGHACPTEPVAGLASAARSPTVRNPPTSTTRARLMEPLLLSQCCGGLRRPSLRRYRGVGRVVNVAPQSIVRKLGTAPQRTPGFLLKQTSPGKAQRINVLSQHRLLREPGGFEGLGFRPVLGDSQNPAFSEGAHKRGPLLDLDAAGPPEPTLNERDDDAIVASVHEISGPPVVVREHLLPAVESGNSLLPTAIHPALRSVRDSVLELRVEVLGKGLGIIRIPGLECTAHDLDVLLRHRLLRESGGFEGFLGSRVEIRSGDQSLLDRVDEAVVHLDPRAAAVGLTALVKGGHYPVPSRVDDLHRLVEEVVVRL